MKFVNYKVTIRFALKFCNFSLKEETTMPVTRTLVSAHVSCSLTDTLDSDPDDEEEEDSSRNLTPPQKLTLDMCHDEKIIKELIVGKKSGIL